MSEVVATFCTTDGWHERADPAAQATNSPLGDLSQEGFEFAERHLDRIKTSTGQLPLPIQKRVRRGSGGRGSGGRGSSCAMLADVSATKRPAERALSFMSCIADNLLKGYFTMAHEAAL
jgi:hypothetical protein